METSNNNMRSIAVSASWEAYDQYGMSKDDYAGRSKRIRGTRKKSRDCSCCCNVKLVTIFKIFIQLFILLSSIISSLLITTDFTTSIHILSIDINLSDTNTRTIFIIVLSSIEIILSLIKANIEACKQNGDVFAEASIATAKGLFVETVNGTFKILIAIGVMKGYIDYGPESDMYVMIVVYIALFQEIIESIFIIIIYGICMDMCKCTKFIVYKDCLLLSPVFIQLFISTGVLSIGIYIGSSLGNTVFVGVMIAVLSLFLCCLCLPSCFYGFLILLFLCGPGWGS